MFPGARPMDNDTPIDNDMPSHSMRIFVVKTFAVKTFANYPKTSKFAKVFTCERFPLYGILVSYNNHLKVFFEFLLFLNKVGVAIDYAPGVAHHFAFLAFKLCIYSS